MKEAAEILIADDDVGLASNLKDILEAEGYNTTVAHDGKTALNFCPDNSVDLALVDIKLPDMSGVELIQKLSKQHPRAAYIIITGYAALDSAIDAVKQREIVAYETKPLAMEHILTLIRQVIERKRTEKELHKAHDYLDRIINGMYESLMIIDRDYRIVDVNKCFLESYGKSRKQTIGHTCYEITHRNSQPCSGAECLCPRKVIFETGTPLTVDHTNKDKHGEDLIVEVSSFPLLSPTGEVEYVVEIQHDITERKRMEEERKQSARKLLNAMRQTIRTIATTIELRDPYTAGHQLRVTALACAIARELGLSEDQIEGLRMAGFVHDIGKIAVPSDILSKPGRLSEIEFALIKVHPQAGYDILGKGKGFPWPIAQIVLQHHERMDGSGYPSGISGEDIIFEARILAVADVVEAMSSHRPYRPAIGINGALEEISKKRGIWYDPQVVDACIRLFHEKNFKFK